MQPNDFNGFLNSVMGRLRKAAGIRREQLVVRAEEKLGRVHRLTISGAERSMIYVIRGRGWADEIVADGLAGAFGTPAPDASLGREALARRVPRG